MNVNILVGEVIFKKPEETEWKIVQITEFLIVLESVSVTENGTYKKKYCISKSDMIIDPKRYVKRDGTDVCLI